ncbi:hypothetical protein CHUAL_000677 [Chamberlinius hualienensis]
MDISNATLELDNCSINVSVTCDDDVVSLFLQRYYVIVLVVLGVVGNFLSCCVFMLTKLRSKTSSIYLTALAISDSCFLMILLYHELVPNVCEKFIIYATCVFTSLSTWIIVCFTVERFIAVQYPLQRPIICTLRLTKFIIVAITIAAILSNIVPLFLVGMTEEGGCVLKGYEKTYDVFVTVESIMTLVLPAILIVGMNTRIAIKLNHFARHYQHEQIPCRNINHVVNDQSNISFTTNSTTKTSIFNTSTHTSMANGQNNNSKGYIQFTIAIQLYNILGVTNDSNIL